MSFSLAFGCTTQHHRCLGIIAPHTIITSTGRHVSYYNTETDRTTFLEVTEPGVLRTTAAAVSPSGKYIALLQAVRSTAAAGSEAPALAVQEHVSVYNLKLGKLCSCIGQDTSNAVPGQTVVDFGFSEGLSKTLFICWGQPQPQTVLYRWYTSKVQSVLAAPDMSRMVGDPTCERHFIAVAGGAAMRIEQDSEGTGILKRCLHTLPKVCITTCCNRYERLEAAGECLLSGWVAGPPWHCHTCSPKQYGHCVALRALQHCVCVASCHVQQAVTTCKA